MAHISHRLGPFTGHVGGIRFRNGEAETDDEDMLMFFLEDSDTYDVTLDGEPRPDDPKPSDDEPVDPDEE